MGDFAGRRRFSSQMYGMRASDYDSQKTCGKEYKGIKKDLKHIDKYDITTAGFDYIGSKDNVHCFICLLCGDALAGVSYSDYLSTKEESTTPKASVPESPMNIFDRLPKTLCRKNGIRAPVTIAANAVISVYPIL